MMNFGRLEKKCSSDSLFVRRAIDRPGVNFSTKRRVHEVTLHKLLHCRLSEGEARRRSRNLLLSVIKRARLMSQQRLRIALRWLSDYHRQSVARLYYSPLHLLAPLISPRSH